MAASADTHVTMEGLHVRVSLVVFGENCTAQVKQAANGDTVFEVKRDSADEIFVGTHPTAPFAKLWLKLGRDLPPVSGLKAFGFMNASVQRLIREDMHAKCPHLCHDDGAWPSSSNSLMDDNQPALTPSTIPPPHSAHTISSEGGSAGAPTGGEDEKGGNRANLKRQIRPPLALRSHLTEQAACDGTRRSQGTKRGLPQQARSSQPMSHRRVDRPRSRVEGTDMLVLEGECARGRQERGSRKSPNGTKGIKGFTGFTSFGLEQRPSFRKTHPYASSQAIEKMVGDAWGSLTKEEKEAYKAKAQQQARERRSAYPAKETQALLQVQPFRMQQQRQSDRHKLGPVAGLPSLLRSATPPSSSPAPPPLPTDGFSDNESLEVPMRGTVSLGESGSSLNRLRPPLKQEWLGAAMHSNSGSGQAHLEGTPEACHPAMLPDAGPPDAQSPWGMAEVKFPPKKRFKKLNQSNSCSPAEEGPPARKDLSPTDRLGHSGYEALRALDRWAALNMVAEKREHEAAHSH